MEKDVLELITQALTEGRITEKVHQNEEYILLNDFTSREIRLHNADRFNRMIALGSIQRYAV